jgi:hypothetical protein
MIDDVRWQSSTITFIDTATGFTMRKNEIRSNVRKLLGIALPDTDI